MENKKIFKILIVSLVFFGAMVGAIFLYFEKNADDFTTIFRAMSGAPGCTPATFRLTVRAKRGDAFLTGVQIAKSGPMSACPSGQTEFTCVDNNACLEDGLTVTYVAPATFQGSNFIRWDGNCSAGTDKTRCTYMSGSNRDGVIIAIYESQAAPVSNTLHINSDPTGLSIAGITTNHSIAENNTITKTLTAPSEHQNRVFDRWSGCDSVPVSNNRICSVAVSGGATKTITAYYKPKTTSAVLTIKGIVNGKTTEGIPISIPGEGVLRTGESITKNRRIELKLTAPDEYNNVPWDKDVGWTGCDLQDPSDRGCGITVELGQPKEVVANYRSADIQEPNTLHVKSLVQGTTPTTGVAISHIRNLESAPGATDYSAKTTTVGPTSVSIEAPQKHPANAEVEFYKWSGCDRFVDRRCDVDFRGGEEKTVTAHYDSQWVRCEDDQRGTDVLVLRYRSLGQNYLFREDSSGRVNSLGLAVDENTYRDSGLKERSKYDYHLVVGRDFAREKIVASTSCETLMATWAWSCSVEPRSPRIDQSVSIRANRPGGTPDDFNWQWSGFGDQIDNFSCRQDVCQGKFDKAGEYKISIVATDRRMGQQARIDCPTTTVVTPPSGTDGIGRPDDDDPENLLGIKFKSPLRHTSLMELFNYLIRLLFWLGLSGMSLIVIIGAFQMIFSGGDPAKFARGQRTIMYGAIGLVIILLSWTIVAIIRSSLTPG